jgi:transposase-like protein
MEKRLRLYWKSTLGYSWRADETYIKIKGQWKYLYRAVDKRGYTIDFYLSSTRNLQAAKRFLGKALRRMKIGKNLKPLIQIKLPLMLLLLKNKEGRDLSL